MGHLLLTACLAALGQASVPAADQSVGPLKMRWQAVRIAAGKHEIGLADLLLVEVETIGAGIEVEVPRPLTRSVGWQVHQAEISDPKEKGSWRGRWWLEPRALGEVSLRLEPFRYRVDKGGLETATWQAVTVRVTSTTKHPDLKYLRDGVDIEPLPPLPPREFAWWPWAVCGGVAGGGLTWWWLRRRGPVPPVDPDAWAQGRLQRLEAWNLPARGAGRRHAYLLSALLRRWLERKYGLAATRQTTPEFLRTLLETKALPTEQQAFLEDFLCRCDLVKFAAPETSEQIGQGLAASVARFLKSRPQSGP